MDNKMTSIDRELTRLSVLKEFYDNAMSAYEDIVYEYTTVGECPVRVFNNDTARYEDVVDPETGEIKMRSKWDYVRREELSLQEECKANALRQIMDALMVIL